MHKMLTPATFFSFQLNVPAGPRATHTPFGRKSIKHLKQIQLSILKKKVWLSNAMVFLLGLFQSTIELPIQLNIIFQDFMNGIERVLFVAQVFRYMNEKSKWGNRCWDIPTSKYMAVNPSRPQILAA